MCVNLLSMIVYPACYRTPKIGQLLVLYPHMAEEGSFRVEGIEA